MELYNIKDLPLTSQNQIFLQLFNYCKTNDWFNVGFYIKDISKMEKVESFINFAMKYYEEDINDVKINKTNILYDILFLKTESIIRILLPSENIRGNKHNFLIIDKDIEQDKKDYIIYPTLVPQIKNSEKSFEYIEHPINNIEFYI